LLMIRSYPLVIESPRPAFFGWGKYKGEPLNRVTDIRYLRILVEKKSPAEPKAKALIHRRIKALSKRKTRPVESKNGKPFTFTFGRFKGQPLTQITDEKYLRFLINSGILKKNPKELALVKEHLQKVATKAILSKVRKNHSKKPRRQARL